ncbi:DnaJ sub C member 3 [Quaeritorhiza haematococci]|nr:DnaJ sub C member 3 [Quaeritorhiza haematococci]
MVAPSRHHRQRPTMTSALSTILIRLATLSLALAWTTLVLSSTAVLVAADVAGGLKSVSELLDDAKAHIGAGKVHEALQVYESAIALEPENALTYFKRAVTYLTLGRNGPSLRDFTKVLELKPDFHQALLQRAKIYVKEGDYENALEDLESYKSSTSADSETLELLKETKNARESARSAQAAINSKNYDQAIEHLAHCLSVSPHNIEFRMQRAEAYVEKGDFELAVGDFSRASTIKPDNTIALLKLSNLHVKLGEPTQALSSVRECLKYDPEHKQCKKTFKEIKKLDKSLKKMEEMSERRKWKDVLGVLQGNKGLIAEVEKLGAKPLLKTLYEKMCQSFAELKEHDKSVTWCSKTLELDSQNLEALLYRAQSKMAQEEYEEAMRDYQKAHEINQNDSRASEGYQRAQRLMRMAGRKDYYKVLGVPRDASTRDIKKAFRKLAQKWHPDKYEGDLPQEQVVKKMSEINEAYEVLSNDELRARFDNGDDPNDQNGHSGAHDMFNQFFAQGGFPFGHGSRGSGGGGGPFQFKFNFG